MEWSQITPVVVKVVDEPTRETTVADILLGAVGLVGAVLLAALLVGLLAGVLLFFVRWIRSKSRDSQDGPAMPFSPLNR